MKKNLFIVRLLCARTLLENSTHSAWYLLSLFFWFFFVHSFVSLPLLTFSWFLCFYSFHQVFLACTWLALGFRGIGAQPKCKPKWPKWFVSSLEWDSSKATFQCISPMNVHVKSDIHGDHLGLHQYYIFTPDISALSTGQYRYQYDNGTLQMIHTETTDFLSGKSDFLKYYWK